MNDNDHNAFHVISNIQTDLYILRGISKLVLAIETAMEEGENEPAVFFPGLFAIHCQLDDFEREIDKECQSYFECLQKDKAAENQDELLSALKEKPELVPALLSCTTLPLIVATHCICRPRRGTCYTYRH